MTAREELKFYFKNELRNTRTKLNVTQEEMAEQLKISSRAYSDLENGKNFCSAYVLINFVNRFDIDKEELFSNLNNIINNIEK